MRIELDPKFRAKLSKKIEAYNFEVGVLDEKPRREALFHKRFESPELGAYAGGPVRKLTRQRSAESNAQVLVENMERLNTNLLAEPFEKQSSDIIKFTNTFLKMVTGTPVKKRIENLLQAIVRNPILRGDYGSNSSITADNKGFDRSLIDTGQMFKSIKARVNNV